MKRMTQETFRLNNGDFCPFCQSGSTDYIEDSMDYLEEQRECLDCGKAWIEKHKIAGYKEIKNYERKETI